jgi:hypothetical protein
MATPMNAELIALLRASPEIDLLHREAAYRQEAMEATGLQVGCSRGYRASPSCTHIASACTIRLAQPTLTPRVLSLAFPHSLRFAPSLPPSRPNFTLPPPPHAKLDELLGALRDLESKEAVLASSAASPAAGAGKNGGHGGGLVTTASTVYELRQENTLLTSMLREQVLRVGEVEDELRAATATVQRQGMQLRNAETTIAALAKIRGGAGGAGRAVSPTPAAAGTPIPASAVKATHEQLEAQVGGIRGSRGGSGGEERRERRERRGEEDKERRERRERRGGGWGGLRRGAGWVGNTKRRCWWCVWKSGKGGRGGWCTV